MASIHYRPDSSGKKFNVVIQFTDPINGKRRTVSPGKLTKKEGAAFHTKLERLLFSRQAGTTPEADVAEWIGKIDQRIAKQFTEWGLITPRVDVGTNVVTLGKFLDDYFKKRVDVEKSTQVAYGRVRRHLVAFFGENTDITTITAGQADDWQLYLQTAPKWKLRGLKGPSDNKGTENGTRDDDDGESTGLALNTVRRHISYARQFFKVACRHKLIAENPFIDLKCGSVATPERQFFLNVDDSKKLIEACPNGEWRLIVALARFGGLRTPSETFALKWEHVDWERGRITVQSPKTKRYVGHDTRVIPIFPELLPYLKEQFDPEQIFVIPSYRETKKNLRTRFQRIIKRAGLTPWPRLFQNLRSTRQTELEETFPTQVVTSWMGNSEKVAKKHYLQVTDEHFAKGLMQNSASLSLQQQPATDRNSLAPDRIYSQSGLSGTPYCETVQEVAASCLPLADCLVGDTGPEYSANSQGNNALSQNCASPALLDKRVSENSSPDAVTDVTADQLADAWKAMTPEARAAALAFIRKQL